MSKLDPHIERTRSHGLSFSTRRLRLNELRTHAGGDVERPYPVAHEQRMSSVVAT